MGRVEEHIVILRDRFSKTLGNIKRNTGSFRKSVGGLQKSVGKPGGSSGLVGSLGGLTKIAGPLAAVFAVKEIVAFGAASVRTAAQVEGLNNAIVFASGSAEEGAKNLQFLKDITGELGLPALESSEGFKTLIGSMMGTSIQGQGVRDIFSQVSTAVSAMNLDGENAKGVFLALGQIMSKGKVQAEELRGQLGERIPGAFGIAARSMGVTQAELNKLLETGKVLADDFLPKFAKELDKTFRGALGKSTQSLQANMNRLGNTFLDVKVALGNALAPAVTKVTTGIITFVNFVKNNVANLKKVFAPITEMVMSIVGGFREAITATGLFGEKVSILETVFNFLGNVLLTVKPILMGIAEVFNVVRVTLGKIVGSMVEFLKRNEGVVKALSGLVGAFIASFNRIKKAAVRIFKGVGDIIAGVFNGDIDQITKGLKDLGGGSIELLNPVSAAKEISAGFKKGFEEGFPDVDFFKDKPEAKKTAEETKAILGGKPATTTGETGKLGSGLAGVTAAAPKTFNINIEKLVEKLIFNTQNLKDSSAEIKRSVTEALLTAVNDSQIIAGR